MADHRRHARLPTLAVLFLLLLFAQSADLVHSHGDSLDRQFDCEICLKIGSGNEALPASGLLPVTLDAATVAADHGSADYSHFLVIPRSRAPPHA